MDYTLSAAGLATPVGGSFWNVTTGPRTVQAYQYDPTPTKLTVGKRSPTHLPHGAEWRGADADLDLAVTRICERHVQVPRHHDLAHHPARAWCRTDLSRGPRVSLQGVWKQPRPDLPDVASLVEAALHLGPRPARKVYVLTTDLWTQALEWPA